MHLLTNIMFNHHIIKKITFMEEGKYFHDNLLKGIIAACFLYYDALEMHVSARSRGSVVEH